MADMMTFPSTVEEFMENYKITDTEQIYTNGAELVPIFRMKQWFEHLPSAQPDRRYDEWCNTCKEYDQEKHCCPRWNRVIRTTLQDAQRTGRWIDGKVKHIKNGELRNVRECSECGSSYFVYDYYNSVDEIPKFCPNCGADMRGEQDG